MVRNFRSSVALAGLVVGFFEKQFVSLFIHDAHFYTY